MKITERFDRSLGFAVHLHRHQFRKGGELPYVGHLLGVCGIALENGADEDEAIAALLHDSIEDQAEGTDDWVLAQDSPFATHLENASSQQGPPDQTTVDSAPTLARLDAPPSVEGEQPHETLSARSSQLGSAKSYETERSVRLTSIKAIVEKLKHVDLTNAHYALGKKAYELKIDQDHFSDQYREVSTLEETIKAKKAGNASDESATVMENFRGAAINAKSAVEAEALEIRRKQWLIKIGREYRPSSVPITIKDEFTAVGVVEAQIEEREAEYASVSADRTSFTALLQLLRSALPKMGMQAGWRYLMLFVVCALVYLMMRSGAALPNRGGFAQALATVRIVSDARGANHPWR